MNGTQLIGQPPNLNGHVIQQQKSNHVGDGLGEVSVVDSSSSLDGNERESSNETLNTRPVNVDSVGLTTAALTPLSPAVPTTSPTTPTPSSMHFAREGEAEDEKENQRGTKIIIPTQSTLVSSIDPNLPNTSSNSNPTSSRPTSTSIDTTLFFSNRPAPPSPSLSRRVSGAPSMASSTHSSTSNLPRSPSTRRPSLGMSRASLRRMSGVGSDAKRQSLGIQLSQVDGGGGGGSMTPTASSSPLGSPHKVSFTPSQVDPQTSSSSTTQQVISPTTTEPSDPIPTPTITPTITPTAITTFSPPQPSPTPSTHVYIKVRDFGYVPTDERHLGLGADTPKANRVNRLNRKLGGPDRARARAAAAAALDPSSSSAAASGNGRPNGTRRTDSIGSVGSVDSSDADAEEEEEDGEDEGWGIGISGWGKGGSKGWNGFKLGMGRFSWTIGSSHSNDRSRNEVRDNDNNGKDSKGTTTNGGFPSRKDLDMNFMDSSSSSSDDDERRGRAAEQPISEEFNDDDDDDFDESIRHIDDEDADGEDEEPQEPLYPGLYRALYAFEPEGTAEMRLDEDQMVRVVGRGGGVGWAVVVDERGWDEEDEEVAAAGGRVQVKHALVPEGYLEVVRLDWEEEEEELVENEDGDVAAVKVEDAEGI